MSNRMSIPLTGANLALAILAAALVSGCTSTAPKSANPDRAAMVNTQLGNGYLSQGRLELAKAKFEKALEQDSGLAAAHAGYGLLWSRLGEAEKAERHFKKALRREPHNSEFLNNYGTFLCSQGEYEKAEEQFFAALKDPLYDTPEYAYTNAGRCALKAGEHDKAEGYFGKALKANPRFADALFQMAVVNERRGKDRLAYAYIEQFEKHGSHSPETLWLAMRLAESLGDKNAAASYRLLLKNKFPDSRQAGRLKSR
jgi:type IV pilus assembly protein PilF